MGGGWGVVLDDVAAGVMGGVALGIAWRVWGLPPLCGSAPRGGCSRRLQRAGSSAGVLGAGARLLEEAEEEEVAYLGMMGRSSP